MIPLDEVPSCGGNQARPPTPPRRRGGSPSRLLETNLAEATSEGHGGGRGILKKNREESNSPRIISKIDEERRKGEKFRNKSFSEEKEREGKVMNGKLKSPQRCGTDCRSLLPSFRHSPSLCPAAAPPGSPIHPSTVNVRGIVLLSVLRAIEEHHTDHKILEYL